MTLLFTLLVSLIPNLALADGPGQCTPDQYWAQRPDVASAGIDAYTHYAAYGRAEGMCQPTEGGNTDYRRKPAQTSREVCSPAEYLRRRPDVAAARVDVVTHYNMYGRAEGMCTPSTTQAP